MFTALIVLLVSCSSALLTSSSNQPPNITNYFCEKHQLFLTTLPLFCTLLWNLKFSLDFCHFCGLKNQQSSTFFHSFEKSQISIWLLPFSLNRKRIKSFIFFSFSKDSKRFITAIFYFFAFFWKILNIHLAFAIFVKPQKNQKFHFF